MSTGPYFHTSQLYVGNPLAAAHPLYQSLCFDDVLLRPTHSRVQSRSHINISSKLAPHNTEGRQIYLKKPLISSPMDTVTDSRMAINMALNGGLGIIHRFMSLDDQVAEIARVKRYVNYIFYQPYTISPTATISEAIELARQNGVTTLCVTCPATTGDQPQLPVLQGLLTRRDMQPYLDKLDNPHSQTALDEQLDLETPVSNIMTQQSDLLTIKSCYKTADDIERNPEYLDKIMGYADYIMKTYRVEKVPIIYSYYHDDYEYGDIESHMTPSGKLVGLITIRSVEFYMRRRHLACLDRQGRLCVGAAVSIKSGIEECAKTLVQAGADLLCVDVANGHNAYTIAAVATLRKLLPTTVIMAGNVVTAEGYRNLALAGADCVRVGIGNGSICTTRLETGVGFGQFSAIQEIHQESLTLPIYQRPVIISDGGSLGKTGNKVKALAAGADAVMLGRSLATCEESPGSIIIKDGKRMKYYRGMASTMASLSNQEKHDKKGEQPPMDKRAKKQQPMIGVASEGVDGMVEVQGSVKEKLDSIAAGIKSGLSYLDVFSMEELGIKRRNNQIEWARCTAIGMSETGTRIQKF